MQLLNIRYIAWTVQLLIILLGQCLCLLSSQCSSCSLGVYQQMYQCKRELRVSHRNDLSAQVDLLSDCLSPRLKCVSDAASERGASNWLTTLPVAGHGFALNKFP